MSNFWSTWLLLGGTYVLVLNPIRVFLLYKENWYTTLFDDNEARQNLRELVGPELTAVLTLLVVGVGIVFFPVIIFAHAYKAVTGKKLFEVGNNEGEDAV